MYSLGTVDLSIMIQGLTVVVQFCMLRNLSISSLLGAQFLSESRAVLDFAQKSLSLYDGLVIVPLISNFDKNSVLLLKQTTTIPPRS